MYIGTVLEHCLICITEQYLITGLDATVSEEASIR